MWLVGCGSANYLAVFLVIFTLACTGTLVFQCLPVQAAWDASLKPTAKCYSMEIFMDIGLFNSCRYMRPGTIFIDPNNN
jgi:hypothetical protein